MFQDRAQGAAPDLYAYKTDDESVVDSTTLQDDDQLTVGVKSGRKYIFIATLFVTDASNSGIKVAMSGTATATYFIANAFKTSGTGGSSPLVGATTTSLGSEIIAITSNVRFCQVWGSLEPATDGTFLVQWANASGGVATTTVKRGSSLSVWRLA